MSPQRFAVVVAEARRLRADNPHDDITTSDGVPVLCCERTFKYACMRVAVFKAGSERFGLCPFCANFYNHEACGIEEILERRRALIALLDAGIDVR